jgi:glutamate---cysteine ligase / carboxylate-amine ligase
VNPGDQRPTTGARPRLGVEEEFFVVDPATRSVVPHADTVLDHARPVLGERVSGEITKFQVETRTRPCDDVGELLGELAEARAELRAAAAAASLRVIASGTPVLGDLVPQPITEGPRQARGTATYRGLHDELSICALHVHVEMPDRDRAVLVSNHLRQYLPTLIALAANSPYWQARDTGYASWRTIVWTRWPVAGPPPYFTSAAHYDAIVESLIEAEGLVDTGTIFWDLRLSARFPTLEVRVADVPMTARESALLAALIRALAVDAGARVDRGDRGPALHGELLRVAYWRAARDGLSGHGVDVRTGRLVPAGELVRRLLEIAQPVLDSYGELPQVTIWLRDLLECGVGAARQRNAAARRGRLTDVVDHLIGETAERVAESSTAG